MNLSSLNSVILIGLNLNYICFINLDWYLMSTGIIESFSAAVRVWINCYSFSWI